MIEIFLSLVSIILIIQSSAVLGYYFWKGFIFKNQSNLLFEIVIGLGLLAYILMFLAFLKLLTLFTLYQLFCHYH